jgi:hypothetical protein
VKSRYVDNVVLNPRGMIVRRPCARISTVPDYFNCDESICCASPPKRVVTGFQKESFSGKYLAAID